MNEFITVLESDIKERHLSQHPFYEAWNEGKVTREALQEYAKQYYQFVTLFPRLISRIHSNLPNEADRLHIVGNLAEEENPALPHSELWVRFAEGIGVPREEIVAEPLPETLAFLGTMKALADQDPIEACAAVLAYEAQISEIAQLKQRGLETHYGVTDARTLEFFEEHGVVDLEHQKVWKRIIAKHALTKEQQERVRTSLRRALDAQWALLDGIQQAYAL